MQSTNNPVTYSRNESPIVYAYCKRQAIARARGVRSPPPTLPPVELLTPNVNLPPMRRHRAEGESLGGTMTEFSLDPKSADDPTMTTTMRSIWRSEYARSEAAAAMDDHARSGRRKETRCAAERRARHELEDDLTQSMRYIADSERTNPEMCLRTGMVRLDHSLERPMGDTIPTGDVGHSRLATTRMALEQARARARSTDPSLISTHDAEFITYDLSDPAKFRCVAGRSAAEQKHDLRHRGAPYATLE